MAAVCVVRTCVVLVSYVMRANCCQNSDNSHSGTNTGQILVFQGTQVIKVVKGSVGQAPGCAWGSRHIHGHGLTQLPLGVTGMAESIKHNLVATVSTGGNLRIWDYDMNPIGDPIPVVDEDGCRAMCCSANANAQGLTVGTTSGRMHMWEWSELDRDGDGNITAEEIAAIRARKTKILAEGHACATVIATHPAFPMFASGSTDCTVRLWTLVEHRQLGSATHVPEQVSCVCFRVPSPTVENVFGTLLVGMYTGELYEFSLDGTDINHVKLDSCGVQWRAASGQEVTAVKSSPCGRWIAACTNNGGVNVFNGKAAGLEPIWRVAHTSRVQVVQLIELCPPRKKWL